MKKALSLILCILLVTSMLVGCSQGKNDDKNDVKDLDKLVVYFVPSREPEKIIAATEPLKELLKTTLAEEGYNVNEVEIQVGTNYGAVGEALGAGTAHVGFIPGGTYVLYDEDAEVILTATRAGLNKDSEKPKDWNDGKETTGIDKQVTYYHSLIIAGPSKKGQELAEKINNGEELTAEDLKSAKWGVGSPTSSASYIYPTIWLKENFKITLTDIPGVVQTDGYGSTMARLASGQIDIGLIYADARRDYAEKWTTEYSRTKPVWEETNVIGVTAPIYNDTISVSKTSEIMTDGLKKALQNAFIKIAGTEEGKEVIKIYNHQGYKEAVSADYDKERTAQEIIKGLK